VRQTRLAHIKALRSSTNLICTGFEADQGQKPRKSARGGGVLGPTRGKNPAKVPVVGVF